MHQLLVRDVLRSARERHPHRIAVALADRTVTFGEVHELALSVSASLLGLGVDRGDRIAWVAPTSIEAVPMWAACMEIGAVFVPLSPAATAEERAMLIEASDPALVVGLHEASDTVSYGELAERGVGPDWAVPFSVREHDPAMIFFTSGTTGRPKGVVLSNRAQRLRAGSGGAPQGPRVSMFPQFHMAGWSQILPRWMTGDYVALVERADAGELLEAVERHAAHSIYCIPAVWRRILATDFDRYDLSSLRVADTGTSATSVDLILAIKSALPGTTTSIAYGSTEAGSVCSLYDGEVLTRPGSVGTPAPGVRVRLDDAGELWAQTPYLFSGYFRDPGATSEVMADGWYQTGELAERSADGYYSIVGRVRDTIRTGGETVSPAEVELVVQGHPGIVDGAVAGVPDPDWGEVITAFIVTHPNSPVSLDSLREHCSRHLAAFKVPRRVVHVEVIPRTGATRQVQRRLLVDRVEPMS